MGRFQEFRRKFLKRNFEAVIFYFITVHSSNNIKNSLVIIHFIIHENISYVIGTDRIWYEVHAFISPCARTVMISVRIQNRLFCMLKNNVKANKNVYTYIQVRIQI
jgi:hypothetical protein